jgi:hypothetical protein
MVLTATPEVDSGTGSRNAPGLDSSNPHALQSKDKASTAKGLMGMAITLPN